MNSPVVRRTLGVNPALTFQSCNTDMGRAFAANGDGMRNSARLLPELIDNGVRLLVYAGNADMGCNFMVSLPFAPRPAAQRSQFCLHRVMRHG